MGAFSPLIPGIHKHQSFRPVAEAVQSVVDGVDQPKSEEFGGTVRKDRSSPLPSGSVVPVRAKPSIEPIARVTVVVTTLLEATPIEQIHSEVANDSANSMSHPWYFR